MSRGYLTGAEALDVSRLTGLPLSSPGHRLTDPPDIHPDSRHPGPVFLDLTRLDWWDRLRVTFTRIAGHMLTRSPL